MTRRRLRPDEIELWRKVTETAHRLHPDRPRSEDPKPKPRPEKTPQSKISRFQIGEKAGNKIPPRNDQPLLSTRGPTAPVKMDKKAFGRLKRGKIVPEGKLDLHGMTAAQAHPALAGFILRSHSQDKRLVLVITGKGKSGSDHGPIPQRVGVLRHNVPHWLSLPPLASVVLQVSEAHAKHGGGGAFYVYLRRKR